jgi:sarcosine oxidase delta subunit
MKATYKMVFRAELQEHVMKTNKARERMDPEDITDLEILNAFFERANDEGKEGWMYLETCRNFGSYLFVKDADSKEAYEYIFVNTEDIDNEPKTNTERMNNILEKYTTLGKEGWEFKKEIYVADPFPHMETMFIRKITPAIATEKAKEQAKADKEKAAKPPAAKPVGNKQKTQAEKDLDKPEADE